MSSSSRNSSASSSPAARRRNHLDLPTRRLHRCVRGRTCPIQAESAPSADQDCRRVLAGRQQPPDAAAHLRHRVVQPQGPRRLPHPTR
jgi:hypothetical protein